MRRVGNKNFVLLAGSFLLFSFVAVHMGTLEEKVAQLKKEKKLVAYHPERSKTKVDNRVDTAVVSLGKKLFYDTRLSAENNVSCASCHVENKGFSNGEVFGKGTHGNKTKRNVPHLYNLGMNTSFFWDGRVTSLEDQLTKVLTSKDELDMSFTELVKRLSGDSLYHQAFRRVFPREEISKTTITKAMVAFELSLKSSGAAFDRFLDGDSSALTTRQQKGFGLFISKANCVACHRGANLTDGTFHNVGVKTNDLGRSLIDKVGMSNDFESSPYPFFSTFKAFKTPSLRNVSFSAPYFHDGSKETLREVVDFYDKGGENPDPTGLAKEIKPLHLEEDEKEALVDFLGAFSSVQY